MRHGGNLSGDLARIPTLPGVRRRSSPTATSSTSPTARAASTPRARSARAWPTPRPRSRSTASCATCACRCRTARHLRILRVGRRRGAARCCATPPRTSWPRPCSTSGPARRSRSGRPSRTASTTTSSSPSRPARAISRASRTRCGRSWRAGPHAFERVDTTREEAVERFSAEGETLQGRARRGPARGRGRSRSTSTTASSTSAAARICRRPSRSAPSS